MDCVLAGRKIITTTTLIGLMSTARHLREIQDLPLTTADTVSNLFA